MTDLTLLIILFLFPLGLNTRKGISSYIGACFLVIILSLLFGLRHYTVGADSANYAFYYQTLRSVDVFELGFVWFMKGLHFICGAYPFFFLTTSFIIWGLLVRFYRKYSILYWLATFLFCALGGVNSIANNGIRQGLSITLFLSALPFALDKKWMQYFALSLVAFTFHRSAIFIFPLYFLIQQPFKWWKIVPLIFVFVLVLSFANDITNYLFSDYERYLVEIDQINVGKLVQLGLVSFFAVFPLFYRYKNRLSMSNQTLNNMFLWLMPVYLLCAWGVYLSNVGNALTRLAWYLFPIVFLNFANYLDTKSTRLKLVIIGSLIFLIFCYRFGVYCMSETSDQANVMYYYKFFWQ